MNDSTAGKTTFSVYAVWPVLLLARYAPSRELSRVGGRTVLWDTPLVAVTHHLRAYTAFWPRGGIVNGVAEAIGDACLDAVGKREGLPAYESLGGGQRTSIEASASGELGARFDEISEWASMPDRAGLRTVKFRLMRDPDTTIALLDQVVAWLPVGSCFVIDAVQACASSSWRVDDGIVVAPRSDEPHCLLSLGRGRAVCRLCFGGFSLMILYARSGTDIDRQWCDELAR